jgi:hypothetical protein
LHIHSTMRLANINAISKIFDANQC